MKKIFLVTALAAVTLGACDGIIVREVSRHKQTYTLIGIDPPKHFYIDVITDDGEVHKHVYVSKHCNTWRSLQIGQKLELDNVLYRRGGDMWRQVRASYDAVCPKS